MSSTFFCRRVNTVNIIGCWTCVTSAPRPSRPGWRSWWRSTGSVENGGPSLSWAHPKTHTANANNQLDFLITSFHMNGDQILIYHSIWQRAQMYASLNWTDTVVCQCLNIWGQAWPNPYGFPSGSIDHFINTSLHKAPNPPNNELPVIG